MYWRLRNGQEDRRWRIRLEDLFGLLLLLL